MIKNIFTCVCTFIFNINIIGQWVQQFPVPINEDIKSVFFFNENIGKAVCSSTNNGTVIHTSDGGQTWEIQPTGVNTKLNAIILTDENTAIAVGNNGAIIKTKNGGTSWDVLNSGTIENLNAVSFINSSTGTVVGENGTILRTTNSGNTWLPQISSTTKTLNAVFLLSEEIGIAVGYGIRLRTTNGGATWYSQYNCSFECYWFHTVHFSDPNNGMAIGGYGQPRVFKTSNGGVTWSENYVPMAGTVFNVFMLNENLSYITGISGKIFRSIDRGISWESLESNTSNNLYSIFFIDSNNGIVTGEFGTVLKTTNGGIVWIDEENNSDINNNFYLKQNYPNPFNPTTTITFSLSNSSEVSLKIFNILGEEIATLVSENMNPGIHSIKWSAENLPSGIYVCRFQNGEEQRVIKLSLLK